MKKSVKMTLKITGLVLLLAITFIAGIALYAKSISKNNIDIKEINLLPEQFIDDFTEINKIVKEKYTHLEKKHINIDSLFLVYLEKVKTAKTNDDYKNLLLTYFAELKNGHSFVYLSPTYSIDCGAKLIENRIFIDKIGKSMDSVNIKEKDEILSIDSVSILEWLKQQERFVGASTDEDRLSRAVKRIFFGYSEGARTLLLKTPTGEKVVTLSFVKNSNNNSKNSNNNIKSFVINDSIGYIAINSMMENVVDEFKQAFEELRTKPVLIIDIRNNGGGNSGNSEQITPYLIRKKQKACVSGKVLNPEKNHFEGKLIVLIGVNTFSAAESFALDLKESGNAVFIGSKTGGDTGNQPQDFTTKYGTSFRFPTRKPAQISPKGFPMEGIGISPDFTIYQTVDDYLKNVDTILEFAINKISEIEPSNK